MSEVLKPLHQNGDSRSQTLKLEFLQQEIRQLRDHIGDLEEVIRLNKDALKTATCSSFTIPQSYKSSTIKSSDADGIPLDLNERSDLIETKMGNRLVDTLQEENAHLLETIRKLINERNLAQSKALLSEQLLEEAQRREKENLRESAAKVLRLQNMLQEKDKAIQEYEKTRKTTENSKTLTKMTTQGASPSDDNLKFQKELDALYGFISKKTKEIEQLKNENHELKVENKKLLERAHMMELSPFKPTHNEDSRNEKQVSVPNLDESDVSQLLIPYDNREATQFTQPKRQIPKLNLTKAVELQLRDANLPNPGEQQQQQPVRQDQQAAPQINQKAANLRVVEKTPNLRVAEKPNNHKLNEQIQSLEKQVNELKAQLNQEIIKNETVSQNAWRLKMELNMCSETNVTLINANRKLEDKWKQLRAAYGFYKNFYTKYVELITKQQETSPTRSRAGTFSHRTKALKEKFDLELDAQPVFPSVRDLSRLPQPEQLEAIEISVDSKKVDMHTLVHSNMTLQQSKCMLLELVKEMEIQTRVKELQAREYAADGEKDKKKVKCRSLSTLPVFISQGSEEKEKEEDTGKNLTKTNSELEEIAAFKKEAGLRGELPTKEVVALEGDRDEICLN